LPIALSTFFLEFTADLTAAFTLSGLAPVFCFRNPLHNPARRQPYFYPGSGHALMFVCSWFVVLLNAPKILPASFHYLRPTL
jgi:hypothetical protein